MTWLKRALPAVVLLWTLAAPAAAQVTGRPFEFSAGGGIFGYDTRARLKDGLALGASAGWRYSPGLTFELSGTYGSSKSDTLPEVSASFSDLSADMRFNVRPADNRVVPFILAGLGYGRSTVKNGHPETLTRGAPSLGMGALFNLHNNPRWYARLQVRDVMFRERDALEFSNHMTAQVALHYVWGGRNKDIDVDGVRDWLDKCPETQVGATVDATGCPSDADKDGVWDGIDKCPDTPMGAKVDKKGCPIDSDGDGVADGIDTCADTPKGATVDSKGCTSDSDEDGILDGLDKCPNTPKGAKIDDSGCPIDSDGDGVPDGIDTCEKTPKGAQVDDKGCETKAATLEEELLDTGRIRLVGVNFETAKATLLPDGLPNLDAAGYVLSKWNDLEIEVGGHTDNQGRPAANMKLSQGRAEAVRTYLLGKFPAIKPEQLVAKGYGSSRPTITVDSEAARAINRRVEFKVMNPGVLIKAGGVRRTGGN